jgi:hypothetical protein
MSDPMQTALSELLAASAHGAVRATMDADFLGLIAKFQIKPLCVRRGMPMKTRWSAP